MQLLIPNIHHKQLRAVKSYFTMQGANLVIYKSETQLSQAEGLLILHPIASPVGYLVTYQSWKHYLLKRQVNTKLIVLGIEADNNSRNYLDILNLPKNLAHKLAHASGVQDSIESEPPPATPGIDLQEKLNHFFVGHGNQSIVQAVGKLNSKFAWLKSEMQEVNMEAYRQAIARLEKRTYGKQEMIKAWNTLEYRWEKLVLLLPYIPFKEDVQEIAGILKTLSPYFRSELENGDYFIKESCADHFETLHQIIKNLNEKYGPTLATHIAG